MKDYTMDSMDALYRDFVENGGTYSDLNDEEQKLVIAYQAGQECQLIHDAEVNQQNKKLVDENRALKAGALAGLLTIVTSTGVIIHRRIETARNKNLEQEKYREHWWQFTRPKKKI